MIEPAKISAQKCCNKYTREMPIRAAKQAQNQPLDLCGISNAIKVYNEKAAVVCPEGKLLN